MLPSETVSASSISILALKPNSTGPVPIASYALLSLVGLYSIDLDIASANCFLNTVLGFTKNLVYPKTPIIDINATAKNTIKNTITFFILLLILYLYLGFLATYSLSF